LAETLSRPPGLPECDPSAPCGVAGVIAGAQTYDTTEALVGALSEGKIATAVVPALSLFRLRCDAAKGQAAPAISTLKVLYRQPLYLVVRGGTPAIAKPADWVKKTITLGIAGSDSEVLTLALLDAYRIPRAKVKLLRLPPAAAIDAMRNGTANVGVFLGHVFDTAGRRADRQGIHADVPARHAGADAVAAEPAGVRGQRHSARRLSRPAGDFEPGPARRLGGGLQSRPGPGGKAGGGDVRAAQPEPDRRAGRPGPGGARGGGVQPPADPALRGRAALRAVPTRWPSM
jgi:hypothetical protein